MDAQETPIGYVPYAEDINLEGLKDFDVETLKTILEIKNDEWSKEAEEITEFYKTFGDKLPAELQAQLASLKERLQ